MRLSRLVPALLATVALTVGAAAPAQAALTLRHDDGTREDALRLDSSDGEDTAQQHYKIPGYNVTGATAATVWMYARADECGTSGPAQRLVVNYVTVADFDPCALWPATAYGWHGFAVPLTALRDGGAFNTISVVDLGTSTDRDAYYAVDTSADQWSDTYQRDASGFRSVRGELMWWIELTGTTSSAGYAPARTAFGLHDVGTTTAPRTVTVTSNGLLPLDVYGVTLGGAHPGDFALTGDTCTGQTLPPGATCTLTVTFTPQAKGSRLATATITGNQAVPRSAELYGEGRSDPTVTAITSPADGAVLLPADAVSGTVTDDVGVRELFVRFTPATPGLATMTFTVAPACDAARLACTWSVDPLLTPNRYAVTAWGVDVQGIVESPGAPATFVVVA